MLYNKLVDDGITQLMPNGFDISILDNEINPDNCVMVWSIVRNRYEQDDDKNINLTIEELYDCEVVIIGISSYDICPCLYVEPSKEWYEKYNNVD